MSRKCLSKPKRSHYTSSELAKNSTFEIQNFCEDWEHSNAYEV
jgi:hypothetical protein